MRFTKRKGLDLSSLYLWQWFIQLQINDPVKFNDIRCSAFEYIDRANAYIESLWETETGAKLSKVDVSHRLRPKPPEEKPTYRYVKATHLLKSGKLPH